MVPKFRAWDKRENTMRDVAVLHFTKGGKVNSIEYWNTPFDLKSYHVRNLVLMQSTGLKDKNGVEIFEGDVVKVSDGSNEEDSYISVVKNYANEGYPAFDIEAPSSWHYESNILAAIMGGEYETIEIIGNIWEDAELLEQANEN
ncbi:MAG: YopX family protein [Enterococcus faecalis]|nr:YopX family protein [Enterococcus faecalis]MDU5814380.1 YopX family protein [Enterococcus casseliflavus]